MLISLFKLEICTELNKFVDNAKRFMTNFRSVIEQAPLQVYVSALLFAPRKSIIRKQFEEESPDWVAEHQDPGFRRLESTVADPSSWTPSRVLIIFARQYIAGINIIRWCDLSVGHVHLELCSDTGNRDDCLEYIVFTSQQISSVY